eukprot:61297_1
MEKAALNLERAMEKALSEKEGSSSFYGLTDFDIADMVLLVLERSAGIEAEAILVEMEHRVEESEAEMKDAVEAKKLARALAAKALAEAEASEKKMELLETIDDKYEDTERKRDLSISHAASQVAEDCLKKAKAAEEKEERARRIIIEAKQWKEMMKDAECHLKANTFKTISRLAKEDKKKRP